MRLIVTRHYKTLLNEDGRIIGWGDSPRSLDWQQDIEFVDNRLRKHKLVFDRIYSSALERSRQTARIHADNLGVDLVEDAIELNEINYGRLQIMKKRWVKKLFPRHKEDPDLVYPGGESFHQMQQRSVAYVQSLLENYPGQTIMIVTHAGVIRGLVSYFLELDYAANLARGISHRYIGDFHFDGQRCLRYEELGEPSEFVTSGVINLSNRVNEGPG